MTTTALRVIEGPRATNLERALELLREQLHQPGAGFTGWTVAGPVMIERTDMGRFYATCTLEAPLPDDYGPPCTHGNSSPAACPECTPRKPR